MNFEFYMAFSSPKFIFLKYITMPLYVKYKKSTKNSKYINNILMLITSWMLSLALIKHLFVKYSVYVTSQKCILCAPIIVPFDYFMVRWTMNLLWNPSGFFFYPTYLGIISNSQIIMTPILKTKLKIYSFVTLS